MTRELGSSPKIHTKHGHARHLSEWVLRWCHRRSHAASAARCKEEYRRIIMVSNHETQQMKQWECLDAQDITADLLRRMGTAAIRRLALFAAHLRPRGFRKDESQNYSQVTQRGSKANQIFVCYLTGVNYNNNLRLRVVEVSGLAG